MPLRTRLIRLLMERVALRRTLTPGEADARRMTWPTGMKRLGLRPAAGWRDAWRTRWLRLYRGDAD